LTNFDLTDPDLTDLDLTDDYSTDHVLTKMDAHVSTITTTCIVLDSARLITDLSTKLDNPNGETTLELDSHADTCVLGRDALIIRDYNRPVEVYGYDPNLGSKTYQTVSGVVAYNDPHTGEVFHLIINQVIHIPHLDHHLLCPMQCRVNDVTINKMPKFLAVDTTDHMHTLTITDPRHCTETFTLRLALQGVILLLNVHKPTISDWTTGEIRCLALTSETLTWDPLTTIYEEQENAMTDYSGKLFDQPAVRGHVDKYIINAMTTSTHNIAYVTNDDNFYCTLTTHRMISSAETHLTGHIQTRAQPPLDS
jgi:hypothetical protein